MKLLTRTVFCVFLAVGSLGIQNKKDSEDSDKFGAWMVPIHSTANPEFDEQTIKQTFNVTSLFEFDKVRLEELLNSSGELVEKERLGVRLRVECSGKTFVVDRNFKVTCDGITRQMSKEEIYELEVFLFIRTPRQKLPT